MSELRDEEIPTTSMFHPDNVQQYILLTLLQIKEYLAVIAGNANEKETEAVEAHHDSGRLVYPPPFLSGPGEDGTQDN
jgi:hypothetical protein